MIYSLIFLIILTVKILPYIRGNFQCHDSFYHFAIANDIKRDGSRRNSGKHFIFEGNIDYPPAVHYFLAILPRYFHKRYRIVLAALEGINALLLFSLFEYFLGSNFLALCGVLFFFFQFNVWDWSRMLTPYIFSLFSFYLYVGGLLIFYVTSDITFLFLSVTGYVLAFFTHRMLYFYLIIIPLVAFFTAKSVLYLLPPLTVAVLFSFKYPFYYFKSFITMTWVNIKLYPIIKERSNWLTPGYYFSKVLDIPLEKKDKGEKVSIRQRLKAIRPLDRYYLLNFIPICILIFVSLFHKNGHVGENILFKNIILASLSFNLAAWLIRPLGQTISRGNIAYYHYMAPLYILYLLLNGDSMVFALFIPLFAVNLVKVARFIINNINNADKIRTRYNQREFCETMQYLGELEPGVLFTLPHSEYMHPILYYTRHKCMDVAERKGDYTEKTKYFYGRLMIPLSDLVEKYDINYIMVENSFIPECFFKYLDPYRKIFWNDLYSVYKAR